MKVHQLLSCAAVCISMGIFCVPVNAEATGQAGKIYASEKIEEVLDHIKIPLARTDAAGNPLPLNILILSGGGSYGPWATGVLAGWRKRPDPPESFTVVTGVSTGAMIAPFAYIPKYWEDYSTKPLPDYVKHADDIHRKRFFLALLFKNSLYTLKPLSDLIYDFMDSGNGEDNHGLLEKVANVYENERRLLLIGTVSVESGAFCVWNMGEIAARAGDQGSHDHDKYKKMFHDVLLASAAMPGYHSPVNIELEDGDPRELIVVGEADETECAGGRHIDGGVRRRAFISWMQVLRERWLEESSHSGEFNAYVIVNGKVVPPRECNGKNNLISNAKRGLDLLLYESLLGNLYRLRSSLTCPDGNENCETINFRLSYVPHDEPFEYPIDKFPKEDMARLFKRGKTWGMNPECGDPESSGWCTGIPVSQTTSASCDGAGD